MRDTTQREARAQMRGQASRLRDILRDHEAELTLKWYVVFAHCAAIYDDDADGDLTLTPIREVLARA